MGFLRKISPFLCCFFLEFHYEKNILEFVFSISSSRDVFAWKTTQTLNHVGALATHLGFNEHHVYF